MRFVCATVFLFYSVVGYAFFDQVKPINRYLGVAVGADPKEIFYMYGNPSQSYEIKSLNIKSDIYLMEGSVDFIFGYSPRKSINSVICSTYYELRSACALTVKIIESNGWMKKSDSNSYYLSLYNHEDEVIENLGRPSFQRISENIKDVYYKNHNIFIRYSAGKVVAIGVGKIASLEFYSRQLVNWHSLRLAIHKKAIDDKNAIEAKEKLIKAMDRIDAINKSNAERLEREKVEIQSSQSLNDIKLGEPLDRVLSKCKYPIFISDNAGEKLYRLLSEENESKCRLNPFGCNKTKFGLLSGDHLISSSRSGNIDFIFYACRDVDNLGFLSKGSFFQKVGCGQTLTKLEQDIKSFDVYCSSKGAGRFYSAQGFTNYASNEGNYYQFFTEGNRVEHVILTSGKYVPDGYVRCTKE